MGEFKLEQISIKKIHIAGSGAIGSLLAGAAEKQAMPYALYPRNPVSRVDTSSVKTPKIEPSENEQAKTETPTPYFVEWNDGTEYSITQIKNSKPHLSHNDILVLPLKVHHLKAALTQWLPFLGSNTPVVLLHNGMGGYEIAKSILPTSQPLLLATTSHGAMKRTSTQVIYTGVGATQVGIAPHLLSLDLTSMNSGPSSSADTAVEKETPKPSKQDTHILGPAPKQDTHTLVLKSDTHNVPRKSDTHIPLKRDTHKTSHRQNNYKQYEKNATQATMHEWAKSVCHTLHALLPPVTYQADIMQALWAKLAINVVINPLTALNNITNSHIASEQFAKERKTLCEEFAQVANACGQCFNASEIEQQVIKVAGLTGNNYSSMHQDVKNQRQTEIEAINGYIVNMAQKKGIEVPFNTLLTKQITARLT